MEASRSESEAPSPQLERPGILKPPAGLFESRRLQPSKTLRFLTEPQNIEASEPVPQAERSSEASTLSTELSETSEESASSASSTRAQIASSSHGLEQPRRSTDPGGSPKARLSSWFSKNVKPYLAALSRGDQGSQDRDRSGQDSHEDRLDAAKSDDDRASSSHNQDRRRHRRRGSSAAAAGNPWPPWQDDERWRVALCRYALVSLLGGLSLLLLAAVALRITGTGSDGEGLHKEQQTLDYDAPEDSRPQWRSIGRSDREDVLPDRESTTEETAADSELSVSTGEATELQEVVSLIGAASNSDDE
ncbi:hypothetical protein V5799_033690 [Amblyomma americanum]|uniref:Uncharacterized protein n=1 Tax=Amblyomma americanum TaxID=6943 RepID=A0AAQ4DML4_AMBAM